jgi:carbamoyltransferase
MYVLGLHTSHDASACLMRDGEIRVAIEKERLGRAKHASGGGGVDDVVEYCLRAEGITLNDVDHIVINDNAHRINATVCSDREVRIGHHLAHAWAAIGLSGWETAAVMVIDGEGSFLKELSSEEREVCNFREIHYLEKESAYFFLDGRMTPLRKWTSARGNGIASGTDGIGSTYWYLSQLMFGRDYQDSKVMGLAAYRHPNECYKGVMTLGNDGDVLIDPDWIFRASHPPPTDLDGSFERYAELAATVQAELEAAIIHKARWLREVSGARRLCYGGGVALNCVANTKLYLAKLFDEIFIPFGAGDSANAIGCAYFGSRVLASRKSSLNGGLAS